MYDFEVRKAEPSVLTHLIFGEQPTSFEVVVIAEDAKDIRNVFGDHWLGATLTEKVFSESQALAGDFKGLEFKSEAEKNAFTKEVGIAVLKAKGQPVCVRT